MRGLVFHQRRIGRRLVWRERRRDRFSNWCKPSNTDLGSRFGRLSLCW